MAGELGEAIGLQGKLPSPNYRQIFADTVKMGEMDKAAKAPKKEDEDFDKMLNGMIKIDLSKYHRRDSPLAHDAVKDVIAKLADEKLNNPLTYKNIAPNLFNDLNLKLGQLKQASESKFGFEDYVKNGGYINDVDKKVLDYYNTGNPQYIKGLDLTKTAAIKGFNPEDGSVIFEPFKKIDLGAAIRQNVYTDDVQRPKGKVGGFDIIGNVYDPQKVVQNAATLFQDRDVRNNFETQVKADVLNELKPLYPKIDASTFSDPSFHNDYEKLLLNKFVDYAKAQEPNKEKVLREPKNQNINVNIGNGNQTTPQEDLAIARDVPVSFIDRYGKQKENTSYTSYPAQGQKVTLPSGRYLHNIEGGGEPVDLGAKEVSVSGIEVRPIYKSTYKEAAAQLAEDKTVKDYPDLIEWKPIAFVVATDEFGNEQTYYGDADKLIGSSRYLNVSEKEKPYIVRLTELANKDAEFKNKKPEQTAPAKTPTKSSSATPKAKSGIKWK